MSTYMVKVGESITDVVENATGSLSNWDAVLTANGFDNWTPDLAPGQVLQIPDALVAIDGNTKRQLAVYPVSNNCLNDIPAQITTLFNLFADNWILQTGFWNDNAIWTADGIWNA